MGAIALTVLLAFPQLPQADRGKIVETIARLSHEKYAVRERAMADLSKATRAKLLILAAIATDRDPEVVARSRLVLSSITKREVESLRPLPMIDAMWYCPVQMDYKRPVPADHVQHDRYIDRAGRSYSPPWASYYKATELWLRDVLAAGVGVDFMRPLLADMHAKDEIFIRRRWTPENASIMPAIVDWQSYLKARK